MATSKNSPTAGETAAGNTPTTDDSAATGTPVESGDTPVVSDGEVSTDRVQEEAAATNDDYARQYPPAQPEIVGDEEPDQQDLEAAAEEIDAEPGETWAKYNNTNHTRGWTVAEQRRLGVPEDKLVDNRDTSLPAGMAPELLEPGVYWSNANRHRVNISDFPTALVLAIGDEQDFEVTKY